MLASATHAESRVDLAGVRAAPLRDRRVADSLSDAAREPRALRIDTQPSGVRVEIAYLRDGVELARGAGESPLIAQLPALARAGERDRLRVRADSAGFSSVVRTLAARSAEPVLHVELEPLPPRELRVSLLELGDVAELRIASDRALRVRLAGTPRGDRLVFTGAARESAFAAALEALHGAALASARARPLGADLALELERAPSHASHELRLTAHAATGGGHEIIARWIPPDRGAALRRAASRALEPLTAHEVTGCALAFERELRAAVGLDSIARALAGEQRFARELSALALQRVAELSPRGELGLVDGARLDPARALEREVALARVAEVNGALAAIRALANGLASAGAESRALHAWLAPDLPSEAFASALARAAAAERACAPAQ